MKKRMGEVSSDFEEKVDAARVRDFCRAVGADESRGVPPTYMTVLRAGEFELFDKLGFQLSQVLHAEQEYEFREPLRAGDTARFRTKLANVLEKGGSNGGGLSFLTFDTEVEAVRGGAVIPSGLSRTTIVIRGAKK